MLRLVSSLALVHERKVKNTEATLEPRLVLYVIQQQLQYLVYLLNPSIIIQFTWHIRGIPENHRIVGAGSDLWKSPKPLLQQFSTADHTGRHPGRFEIASERETTVSLDGLSGLCCPHSKEFLPHVQNELPVCDHYSLSCHWAPPRRAMPHPLESHLLDTYKQ